MQSVVVIVADSFTVINMHADLHVSAFSKLCSMYYWPDCVITNFLKLLHVWTCACGNIASSQSDNFGLLAAHLASSL